MTFKMNVVKKAPNFQPRDYQLYYLQKAIQNNVIICLGTGSGKTYITIMLLKEYGTQIKLNQKKAIFLAPTNPLVIQQSEEIRKHTIFETQVYYGDLGVDCWNKSKWMQEIDNNDVLVMTPDIFYTVMSKQLIKLQQICVLIFDESHWGGLKRKNKGASLESTNHVYKKIMNFIIDNEFHNRIRIIGTTASVINACFDAVQLPECFKELEKTFNAKILGEFEFDPRFLAEPKIMIWLYREDLRLNEEFAKLYDVFIELDAIIKAQERADQMDENESYRMRLNMVSLAYLADRSTLKPTYVKRMIRDLGDIQRELGVWPTYILTKSFRKELEIQLKRAQMENSEKSIKLILLIDEYLSVCERIHSKTIDRLSEIGTDNAMLNLSSCKLLRLLDVIFCYHEKNAEFSILIFVDRVTYCVAIAKFLEKLSATKRFSYINPSFFVGNNNEYLHFRFIKESVKNSKQTIQDFKEGKLNILVTTAVLEEGIDIGKCNLVIRFSEPKTYREFVQSKGRARAKDSFFVLMHNDISKLSKSIKIFDKTEEFLIHKFKQSKQSKFSESVLPDDYRVDDDEEYIRSSSGSQLKISEAGPWITRYLIKKGVKSYEPQFTFEEVPALGYKCKLNLQGVTPLTEEVEGKHYESKDDAFRSACLAACKKLYEMEQIDDHFIPISDDVIVKRCSLISREYTSKEIEELDHIFKGESKQRLMFQKQISKYSYFKNFVQTSGYHLYEIIYESDGDQYLDRGEFKLALLTELQLTAACKATKLFSSLHVVNVKLNLIESNVQLNQEQHTQICNFTLSMFKNAIPILKKRIDLKIDFSKLLFKFVCLNEQSIDYAKMQDIIEFNPNENISMKRGKILVRATHTNTDYELIATETGVYPTDKFDLNGRSISYNEYFREKYDIIIENQDVQLCGLEKADLISLYSIFVAPDAKANEHRTAKFKVFLPSQLLISTAFSKELYRKVNCLPPLIYRIKQKIILKNLYSSLNEVVLSVKSSADNFENVFTPSEASYDDIDESIHKKYLMRHNLPYFDSSSDESSSGESDETEERNEMIEATKQFDHTMDMVRKSSFKKATKTTKTLLPDDDKVHPSISQVYLDCFLEDSVKSTLKEFGFSNLDTFLNEFTTRFKSILNSKSCRVNLKNFEDIEPKLRKRKLDESEDLKKIDFNIWTNDNSNKFIITPIILLEALTTKSANDAVNLERLEFIGDCFLKLVTCGILFHTYHDLPVGEMDILKMRAISNRNLYGISRRNQISDFLFADKFLPGVNWMPNGLRYEKPNENTVDTLVTIINQHGLRSAELSLVDRSRFQELKAKSVSDGIESLIGGVLTTSGIRNACLFMKYLGIYSDDFELDLSCEKQKNWFKKYDPLECDLNGNMKQFSNEMYLNYDFKSLEYAMDYNFKNKALLIQAFKHVSYDHQSKFPSYERLEFLGDAVIDYLIAKYFYDDQVTKFTPGQLTDLKQAMINNDFFGTISIKFELHKYLIYNSPALFVAINDFKEHFDVNIRPRGDDCVIIPNSYMVDGQENINLDDNFEIHKVLGDIFESLMAAIFIDSELDLNAVWQVLHKFMIRELTLFKLNPPRTFLARMHEMHPLCKFSNCRVENRKTVIEIEIDRRKFIGIGNNKKLARMDAARKVMKAYPNNGSK